MSEKKSHNGLKGLGLAAAVIIGLNVAQSPASVPTTEALAGNQPYPNPTATNTSKPDKPKATSAPKPHKSDKPIPKPKPKPRPISPVYGTVTPLYKGDKNVAVERYKRDLGKVGCSGMSKGSKLDKVTWDTAHTTFQFNSGLIEGSEKAKRVGPMTAKYIKIAKKYDDESCGANFKSSVTQAHCERGGNSATAPLGTICLGQKFSDFPDMSTPAGCPSRGENVGDQWPKLLREVDCPPRPGQIPGIYKEQRLIRDSNNLIAGR